MSRMARTALAVLMGGVLLVALGAPSTAVSKRCRPGATVLGAASAWGGVSYRWAGTRCTTRYRLEVSPAPNGHWPSGPTYTAQGPRSLRGATWTAPLTPKAGDGMVALPYGNPVYARVVTSNARNRRPQGTRASGWVAQWPTAPVPAAGDALRLGTYTLEHNPQGARAVAAAHNIGDHRVTIATLQEAAEETAVDVVGALNQSYGAHWDYVHSAENYYNGSGQELVYRTDLFRLVDTRTYVVFDRDDLQHTYTRSMWASFRAIRRDGSLGRLFYVAPQHLIGTASASWSQNAWTGKAAQLVAAHLGSVAGSAPVIVAGDLRYTREPWGERAGHVPAQPVFVRAGYYDAIASRSRSNASYSTVNGDNGKPSRTQRPYPTGVGPRADYILLKGIRGSLSYYNVVNWSYKGVVPSDHNLVYSDINIPRP